MTLTITFKRQFDGIKDPLLEKIRTEARKDGWVGMAGFKDWAKEKFNATLRSGKSQNWTSIKFNSRSDLERFEKYFCVDHSNFIRKKVNEAFANIKIWQDKITALQQSCSHEDCDITYGGNTGNYDPSADCYWKTYTCNICSKKWTEYT